METRLNQVTPSSHDVIVYNAVGKAWNTTFGRLFKTAFGLSKRSKKGGDEETGEKGGSTAENVTKPFNEKPGSTKSQNAPETPKIPAIIAPESGTEP